MKNFAKAPDSLLATLSEKHRKGDTVFIDRNPEYFKGSWLGTSNFNY